MGVSGIHHTTLAVGDLDRSLSFYRDVLGFAPRAIWSKAPVWKPEHYGCVSRSLRRHGPHPIRTIATSPFRSTRPTIRSRLDHYRANPAKGVRIVDA